jgi:hypothetical protein
MKKETKSSSLKALEAFQRFVDNIKNKKRVIAVNNSQNTKTGIVAATYTPQSTCSDECPLKNSGCYAEKGHTGIHTHRINKRSVASNATQRELALEEAQKIRDLEPYPGRPLRLHVVGDCNTPQAANLVSMAANDYQKRGGGRAWTYTHSWRTVPKTSWNGVSVLASVHTEKEAAAAMTRGYTPAILVEDFPRDHKAWKAESLGLRFIPCPQQTGKSQDCVSCGLCFDTEKLRDRKVGIAFAKH